MDKIPKYIKKEVKTECSTARHVSNYRTTEAQLLLSSKHIKVETDAFTNNESSTSFTSIKMKTERTLLPSPTPSVSEKKIYSSTRINPQKKRRFSELSERSGTGLKDEISDQNKRRVSTGSVQNSSLLIDPQPMRKINGKIRAKNTAVTPFKDPNVAGYISRNGKHRHSHQRRRQYEFDNYCDNLPLDFTRDSDSD